MKNVLCNEIKKNGNDIKKYCENKKKNQREKGKFVENCGGKCYQKCEKKKCGRMKQICIKKKNILKYKK